MLCPARDGCILHVGIYASKTSRPTIRFLLLTGTSGAESYCTKICAPARVERVIIKCEDSLSGRPRRYFTSIQSRS